MQFLEIRVEKQKKQIQLNDQIVHSHNNCKIQIFRTQTHPETIKNNPFLELKEVLKLEDLSFNLSMFVY